jgi:hypothetical protein
MKKKLILSVVCTILLSCGAMAKSNVLSKAKQVVAKKQYVIVQKSLKEKKQSSFCVIYITTCGAKGILCGSFLEMLEGALTAEAAFC